MITHRLKHLFATLGVQSNSLTELFCPWDVFYNFNTGLTQQDSAKKRMDLIWKHWLFCIDVSPEVSGSDCTQYVGAYLDAHVPLALFDGTLHFVDVLRKQLAPEQQNVSLNRSDELVAAVSNLWASHPRRGPDRKPIDDLLQKGKPNVLSVRYIRPQLFRCQTCPTSRKLACEMLKAWNLGQYSNRDSIPGPEMRLKIHSFSFDDVIAYMNNMTSRQLYYVIAECIAMITISKSSLHVQAAGVCTQFDDYVNEVTNVHLKKPQKKTYEPKTIVVRKQKIFQWPLSEYCTKPTQELKQIHVCDNCAVIHVKAARQPRASKCKAGVSINIFNPLEAVCNRCNEKTRLVTITGNITRGYVNNKLTTVTTCTRCNSVCTQPETIEHDLFCSKCVKLKHAETFANANSCPCGDACLTSRTFFILKQQNRNVVYRLCEHHAPYAIEFGKINSIEKIKFIINKIKT